MKLIFRKDLTAILIVFSLTILGQGCSTPENKNGQNWEISMRIFRSQCLR